MPKPFIKLIVFTLALFVSFTCVAQNRVALGFKGGGLMGIKQDINHQREGIGTGTSRWSSSYGYTAGVVLIVPVHKVDYLKFGVQYDRLYNQSFSIRDADTGPDYFTSKDDYAGFRIPITYHKQFEASASNSRRRISFFAGGNFKFIGLPTVSENTNTPEIDETFVLLNHALDPGIIIGAGLINGFKKSGALHFELAFQYHPIKNLNVTVGVEDLQTRPAEYSANTVSLTSTYFFTRNSAKRSNGGFSKCPQL